MVRAPQAMPLVFVDTDGRQGRISDEFSVEYGGPHPVEEYVQAAVDEASSVEGAVEELILEMVADLDVDEVRRVEPTVDPPHPVHRPSRAR